MTSTSDAVGRILKEAGVKAPHKRVGKRRGQAPEKTAEQMAIEEALAPMTAKMVALFSAWVVNGRNIAQAARQVGTTPQYAHRLFTTHPAFLEAKKLLPQILTQEDQEWIEALPQARMTLRRLLSASEEKVQYLAAREIVDRAEGKAISKVDLTIRDEGPSMSDAEMQLAFSIMQQLGKGFAETVQWIRGHPDEVKAWIEQNVPKPQALPSSPEEKKEEALELAPIDADFEVLPEDPPEPVRPVAAPAGPLLAYLDGWCEGMEEPCDP